MSLLSTYFTFNFEYILSFNEIVFPIVSQQLSTPFMRKSFPYLYIVWPQRHCDWEVHQTWLVRKSCLPRWGWRSLGGQGYLYKHTDHLMTCVHLIDNKQLSQTKRRSLYKTFQLSKPTINKWQNLIGIQCSFLIFKFNCISHN